MADEVYRCNRCLCFFDIGPDEARRWDGRCVFVTCGSPDLSVCTDEFDFTGSPFL
jgi:hypothetical protein